MNFTWKSGGTNTIHASYIVNDNGWKITLDRGHVTFRNYIIKETFTFPNRLQQYRSCKAFVVTFTKHKRNEAEEL